MHDIKSQLFQHCENHVDTLIQNLQLQLEMVVDARNNETKSSVGDKYETGRAMMQMEEEKIKTQLFEAEKTKAELTLVQRASSNDSIQAGSLIITKSGTYYISAGLGKVALDGEWYFCISYHSPISQALKGKSVGDHIIFNGNRIEIVEVV